jgi:hypothetical protein
MQRVAQIIRYCSVVVLCSCSAAPQQPFDARRCSRTCIEMADACTASCLKAVDPTGAVRGARETCERACQTQRDTCDVQCAPGKEPAF